MKKHSKPPKRDRLFVKVWEGVVPEREYSFFFCVREKFWVEAGRERCLILKKKVDYCTDCPCLYVFLSSKKSDRNMFSFHIKPFSALTVRELHAVTSLREQVFYLEQRVTTLDADAKDLLSVYLWVESEGETVGTLRMIPRGVSYPEASIGRVSVLPSFRHRGFCRQMMQRAIEYM